MSATPLSPGLLLRMLRTDGHRNARGLGQHFLGDELILSRIAEVAHLNAQTLVLEVGPGAGTLTTCLIKDAGHVIAVEFDERLKPFHTRFLAGIDNLSFVYGDALRLNLGALAREEAAKRGLTRFVLAGNLPFQITSPLLFREGEPGTPWDAMSIMVQKEVADRIASTPGGRDYGILSVRLGYSWRVTERFEVQKHCFIPPPKVDATVLALERRPVSDLPAAEDWTGLSRFIDAAFNQRRKKLYNSLGERWPGAPPRDQLREAFTAEGIDPDARAETLSAEQFYRLYLRLSAPAATQ